MRIIITSGQSWGSCNTPRRRQDGRPGRQTRDPMQKKVQYYRHLDCRYIGAEHTYNVHTGGMHSSSSSSSSNGVYSGVDSDKVRSKWSTVSRWHRSACRCYRYPVERLKPEARRFEAQEQLEPAPVGYSPLRAEALHQMTHAPWSDMTHGPEFGVNKKFK